MSEELISAWEVTQEEYADALRIHELRWLVMEILSVENTKEEKFLLNDSKITVTFLGSTEKSGMQKKHNLRITYTGNRESLNVSLSVAWFKNFMILIEMYPLPAKMLKPADWIALKKGFPSDFFTTIHWVWYTLNFSSQKGYEDKISGTVSIILGETTITRLDFTDEYTINNSSVTYILTDSQYQDLLSFSQGNMSINPHINNILQKIWLVAKREDWEVIISQIKK